LATGILMAASTKGFGVVSLIVAMLGFACGLRFNWKDYGSG
jgi:hypothetical protein